MNATKQFAAASDAVMQLDLEPIKTKLMHVQSGEGWSQEQADAVEKEYRRFLCLMKLYPDEVTAPLVDVDTFWHYHILDTMKYARDCEAVFGYFLHHYPYVGVRGEDDEQFHLDSGERMRTLYEATFGEAYLSGQHSGVRDVDAHIDGSAMAFCAGPREKMTEAARNQGAVSAGPAFCAGPRAETAFCAGPRIQTAFCAGPRDRTSSAN